MVMAMLLPVALALVVWIFEMALWLLAVAWWALCGVFRGAWFFVVFCVRYWRQQS